MLLIALVDPELHVPVDAASRVAYGCADQVEEVTLDPFAREVVRDAESKGLVVDADTADFPEPGGVGRLVEGLSKPGGDVMPEVVRTQLDLSFHAREAPHLDRQGARA